MSLRRLCTPKIAIPLYREPDAHSAVAGTFAPSQRAVAIAQEGEWIQVRFGAPVNGANGANGAASDAASAGSGDASAGAGGWGAAAELVLHDVLLADLSAYQAHPDWAQAETSVQLSGAFLKASEGLSLDDHGWFARNWPLVKSSAGARYGDTWFRGAYHYFIFRDDAAGQADNFLRTVEAAGGWDRGDLLPVVDVEAGGANRQGWAELAAAQIVERVTTYVEKVRAALGCAMILYGGSALRDKHITDPMKCSALWTAEYGSAQLADHLYTDIGWSGEATALWQYTDGQSNGTRFPSAIAGLGGDLSVYRENDLAALAAALVWKR